MTYKELNTLLDYHYWARDRLLDALGPLSIEQLTRPIESSFRSIRDTATHIFAAELVWYSRWQGNPPKGLLAGDTFPDLEALRSAWRTLEDDVRNLVEQLGLAGVERRLDYRMFSGEAATSVFWHMVQHVVNHASYHRGQITTMLRQIGAQPPKAMDLIAFYRERESRSTAGAGVG